MISLTSNSLKVYLVLAGTDMRKSFHGLTSVVRLLHHNEPNPEYLYVFSNHRRNLLKLLYYDRSGVWVAGKRLEQGTFSWPLPQDKDEHTLPLTPEALQLLLDGVDLRGAKLREWYRNPA